MLLSAAGIFSCGRWYHGCICDSERTALLVQEGDSGSMSEKWHCFLSFSRVLFTWCVCFPGWNRAGCHQWLISVRRFHLQTTSQTLQGSALLHPPTGAIYRGSIAPRWWIEHMHTHTASYAVSVCIRHLSKQSSARLWTLWLPPLDRLTWTGLQWTGCTFIL